MSNGLQGSLLGLKASSHKEQLSHLDSTWFGLYTGLSSNM